MNFKSSRPAFAVILTFVFTVVGRASAAPDSPAQFKIQLAWPVAVGDTFHASLSASRKTTVFIRYVGANTDITYLSYCIEAAGDFKILSLDKFGNVDKAEFSVEKLLRDDEAIVAPNSVVTVDISSAIYSFQIDGKPAPKQLIEPLQILAECCHGTAGGGETGDTIFGSQTPRTVGSSWDINKDAYIRSMAKSNFRLSPDNVSGTVNLVDEEKTEGTNALRIRLKMSVQKMKGGNADAIRMDDGTVVADETIVIPEDGTPRLLSRSRNCQTAVMIHGVTEDKHEYTKEVAADERTEIAYRDFHKAK